MSISGFELCAVGDIGLVGKVKDHMTRHGLSYPFRHVEATLQKADFTFGNLEIPFCSNPDSRRSSELSPDFRVLPEHGEALASAGFNAVSLANNHIMDWGIDGLKETIRILDAYGISHVGAGGCESEARRPYIYEKNGIRLGLLAYTIGRQGIAKAKMPGAAGATAQTISSDVQNLCKVADVVVVSLHFGLMYVDYPSRQEQTLARGIIDAGASLVLGHHSHVLKGLERYNGGIIAYSLGDFIFDPDAGLFDANVAPEARRLSVIFRCRVEKEGITNVELVPVVINSDLEPFPADGIVGQQILRRLNELSAPLKDNLSDSNYYRHLGQRLFKYELRGILYHFSHFHWRILIRQLSRIRGRHFRMSLGYLANFASRLRRAASPRS